MIDLPSPCYDPHTNFRVLANSATNATARGPDPAGAGQVRGWRVTRLLNFISRIPWSLY